jgi:putative SOS response-associated peptidase YedK
MSASIRETINQLWPHRGRGVVRLYNLPQHGASRFDNMPARYNIAPTQDVGVVQLNRYGQREFAMLRWGLIPYWAKDMKIAFSTINAMAETLATKPAFREAFQHRRCLVLADGFYEWVPTGAKQKQPYLIRMLDQQPFAFAGLWERWHERQRDDVIESCTIVTVPPNDVCAPIHDRMPAILSRDDYSQWLGEVETTPEELRAMLKPCAAPIEAVAVSTKVNSPKNEGPELLECVG